MLSRVRGLWSAAYRHRGNVTALAIGGAASLLAVAIGTRLQTEFMSPSTFGEVKLAQGVVALGLGLVLRPMVQFAMREFHDARLVAREQQFETFVYRTQQKASWWLGAGVVAALLLLPFVGVAISWQSAAIAGVMVLFEAALTGGSSLLITQNRQKLATVIDVVRQWGLMIAGIVAVLLAGDRAFIVLAGQALATAGIWAGFKTRFLPAHEVTVADDDQVTWSAKLRAFALPLLASNVFGWISGLGDRYFLGVLSDPAELGRYAAVYGLVAAPMIAAGSLAQRAFLPSIFSGAADTDGARGRRAVGQLLLLNFMIAICGCAAMILLGPFAIDLLLGARYREGSLGVFTWLVAAHGFAIFWIALETVFQAQKRTRPLALAQMVGALLTVVMNLLLVPRYGGIGAAIATVAAYASQVAIGVLAAVLGPRPPPALPVIR